MKTRGPLAGENGASMWLQALPYFIPNIPFSPFLKFLASLRLDAQSENSGGGQIFSGFRAGTFGILPDEIAFDSA